VSLRAASIGPGRRTRCGDSQVHHRGVDARPRRLRPGKPPPAHGHLHFVHEGGGPGSV